MRMVTWEVRMILGGAPHAATTSPTTPGPGILLKGMALVLEQCQAALFSWFTAPAWRGAWLSWSKSPGPVVRQGHPTSPVLRRQSAQGGDQGQ